MCRFQPEAAFSWLRILGKNATNEQINDHVKAVSQNELSGILAYETDPVVSSDIVGRSESAVLPPPPNLLVLCAMIWPMS